MAKTTLVVKVDTSGFQRAIEQIVEVAQPTLSVVFLRSPIGSSAISLPEAEAQALTSCQIQIGSET